MTLADAACQRNLVGLATLPRRTTIYIGIAFALLGGTTLLYYTRTTRTPASTSSIRPSAGPTAGSPVALPPSAAPATTALRRPATSVAVFGVLTSRPQRELDDILDRDALAAIIRPAHCGDEASCAAVRAVLVDPHATTLQIVDAADWNRGSIDVDASTTSLSPAERASIPKRPRVVSLTIVTPASSRQLAVRSAFAAAAAIAEACDGLVHDPVLGRVETARAFAAHAVTDPLDVSAFRPDRIGLLFEPKEAGVVRVLTAGLSRWAAPDVEAARVPAAAKERVAEVVLAVARALADGLDHGPLTLSRDDLGRARGRGYAVDAELPPPAPVTIDLASVRPEAGDPNDFIARIEPPESDGPVGYLDLAERFFGPLLAKPPEPGQMEERRTRAQRQLMVLLARWGSSRANGEKLLVQLPFAIPGDAGVESMWIEVDRYDARTLTGKLLDDPLGATNVTRGDEITRPREQVEDVRMAKPR